MLNWKCLIAVSHARRVRGHHRQRTIVDVLLGPWQVEHWLSLATMFAVLWPAPVAKLTLLWQEPQAIVEGAELKFPACGVLVSLVTWHTVQKRVPGPDTALLLALASFCGNTTFEKSLTAPP